jgi:hypothetical protein
MNRSTLFAVRLALFAALVWIGSACGGDRFVGAPLLTEGFNNTFPGANWTAPTTTGAATTQIVNTGDPVLTFATTGPAASTSETTTLASFNNPNLTIAVQEAVDSATPGLAGVSTISIVDASNAVVATAAWDNSTPTGNVSFTIANLPAPSTATLPADGSFHTFKFNVDSAGTATWTLDGATKQNTVNFPAGMVKLRLSASFLAGSAWPSFSFDNISVTSP